MASERRFRYRYGLRRFGVRLVFGMLAASLPVMILMVVLLTAKSSDSLTHASHSKAESLAHALEVRVEDWLGERRSAAAAIVASVGTGDLEDSPVLGLLDGGSQGQLDFKSIVVTDLTGRALASSSADATNPFDEEWFRQATSGQPVFSSPAERDGRIEWVIAEPLFDASGRPQGVLIGYLDVTVLGRLLDAELDEDTEAMVVDANGVVIYDTEMGEIPDDASLLAAGGLSETADNQAIQQARTGETGVARYTDPEGHDVIGGADVIDPLDWVLVAQEHTSSSLAPVDDQRTLAIQLLIVGVVLTVIAAYLFARSTTRPIARLTSVARRAESGDLDARVDPSGPVELVELGRALNGSLDSIQTLIDQLTKAALEVNSAASELSAASDELAATTTQQSAAVTQASATTEELARASSVIADTVDEVARQAAQTRDNLEQAESDIQVSSERTVALAERVNDIGGLLALINEIADQTGLLALNAAIEAARAGEDGRGFAVVADEVRRLADNSKSSAGDIARIIDAVHAETNATVMAMEKGAKQMQQGLALLEHVTEATDQVRLTTQQQRSATAQVVETMEQLTDASRQVSITAQQIAGAAGNLADLAGNLDTTAELAGTGPRE